MKLNIGCGYNRLDGYVNTDLNADTPADRIMPAHDLDFADGSAEEVKALQLIEHLGFFKAVYFLSECRRVLPPQGCLHIETPDIEKAFEIFLSGGAAQKEAVLGWIYGSETPGMNHLYCFPAGLLATLLEEAGFGITESSGFCFQEYRPALRLKAVKKNSRTADLASALRKSMLADAIPCFDDELAVSGQERVVRSLISCKNPGAALEQAVHSAEIAARYFALNPSGDGEDAGRKILCGRLGERNFQGFLMDELWERASNGTFTDKDFNSVLNAGVNIIRRLASGELKEVPFAPGRSSGKEAKIFSRAAAEDLCLKRWLRRSGKGQAMFSSGAE